MTLDEIAEKLAHMSSTVCHAVDSYAVDRFKMYCEEDAEGIQHPKILKYAPLVHHQPGDQKGEENEHEEQPIIHIMETALIPQRRLIADGLKIHLESDVDLNPKDSSINMSLTRGLPRSSARIKVEATFVSAETAESFELIRDHENNHLSNDLKSSKLVQKSLTAKIEPSEPDPS